MTLGVGLLYVGAVLLLNGIGRIKKYSLKSLSIMNFFTGGLYVLITCINLAFDVFREQQIDSFYNVATGMLFGFTYLFVGVTDWLDLDGGPLAWYSLFVGINTIPCSYIAYQQGDIRFCVIWLAWGFLWFLNFIEGAVSNIKLPSKLVPVVSILVGVFTCWIPGFMLLANWW